MKSIPLIALILLCLPASALAAGSGPVILTELGARNLGIETVTVEKADFEKTAFALGWTEAVPENRSIISSRIPGRVVENRLEIGEFVEKGDKLMLIESRQPGDPPPTVWLTAPADGHILKVNALLGAPVDPTDELAEIADLRRLYLLVTMPQSTAGKLIDGAIARVRFPMLPGRTYTALLRPYTGCALVQNISTRDTDDKQDFNSSHLVFTLENKDILLQPDMNAECEIVLEHRSGVLSVPVEAVQGGAGERHVYVKHMTIPYAYDRVNVQTGTKGNGRIEIVDGLFPGDEVVTHGSYSLGFAGNGGGVSLKDALDAAHGHEHNEDGTEKTEDDAGQDGDDHGGADKPIGPRELAFMITSGVFAVALLMVLLRRRGSDTTDLS